MVRIVSLVGATAALASEPQHQAAWEDFKLKFAREYDVQEEMIRKAIFVANMKNIKAENAKGHRYTLGVNQFTDMTPEEYKQRLGFKPSGRQAPSLGVHQYSGEVLADSVDWVEKGAVTPVKDQGNCRSCWAFSTTGGLEGAWQVATGKLASLSEEQLVECSREDDNGCRTGGLMDRAFEFLETVDACSEESYPYTSGSGEGGTCKQGCDVAIPKGGVTGHMDVDHTEEALMSALMKGPVSVAIEADQSSFQHYRSGVLSTGCGTQLDHGVLAVGYGVEDGTKYWKVKNSWGSSWGDSGYIHIERGAGGSGECGILMSASYPVVNGDASAVLI